MDVCRNCAAEGQRSHYCAYKGFASQGQRTLFLKLSVKNQSRHFYHIKQSEAFNRYVTGKKAVWTSWPVFLWEKPAGLKILFIAMVIIMLEMLDSDEDKAGLWHVKMLPFLSVESALGVMLLFTLMGPAFPEPVCHLLPSCRRPEWMVTAVVKHHLRTLQFIQPVQMAKHFLSVSTRVSLPIFML